MIRSLPLAVHVTRRPRSEGRCVVLSHPPEVILQTHDVVFAEVFAALHFDEDQQLVARILHVMRRTDGDVDGLARLYFDIAIIRRDLRSSLDNDPMLGALRMFLVAETLAGATLQFV